MSSRHQCPKCGTAFRLKVDFLDHIRFSSCANEVSETFAACPHCDREFPSTEQLDLHLIRSTKCSALHDRACDRLSRVLPMSANDTSKKTRYSSFNDDDNEQAHNRFSVLTEQTGILRATNQRRLQVVSVPFTSIDGTASMNPTNSIPTMPNIHNSYPPTNSTSYLVQTSMFSSGNDVLQSNNTTTILDSNNERVIITGNLDSSDVFDSCNLADDLEHQNEFDVMDFENEDENSFHSIPQENIAEPNLEEYLVSPNRDILVDTMIAHEMQSNLLISEEMVMLTDLYAMLNRRGIPLHMFELMSQWAWKNRYALLRVAQPPMNRKQYIKGVMALTRGNEDDKLFKLWKQLPQKKSIHLSTGRKVVFPLIGFNAMIQDLLSNTMLMHHDNILWDEVDDGDDPQEYDEVNSGSWWRQATERECVRDEEMLWPIIMFIDGMKVTEQTTLRLEPVTCTFSRFKRHIRNQENAWRTVAFIEEVCDTSFNEDRQARKITPAQSLQEYHDILTVIFDELRTMQMNGVKWRFPSEPNHPMSGRNVILKMPVQFIIGDCEGHDQLCARYGSHLQTVSGLCRDCNVPTSNADDVNWQCVFRTDGDLIGLTDQELQAISFHRIDNALSTISFGGTDRGFFAALVPETLHMLKLGIFPMIYVGIKFSLSDASKQFLDAAAGYFVDANRNVEFFNLPPITAFRCGITQDVTGGAMILRGREKHARLLLLYCLLSISETFEYLSSHVKKETNYDRSYWQRIVKLLEKSLCFHEWLTEPSHEITNILGPDGNPETGIAHRRIKSFLWQLKNHCPTVTGSEFRITKFHQCLHLPRVIYEHGSMLNVDSGRPEAMAKHNLKDPATRTQKRRANLSYQTSIRYLEQLSVHDAQRLIEETLPYPVEWSEDFQYISSCTNDVSSNQNHDEKLTVTGTRFTISYFFDSDVEEERIELRWNNRGELPVKGFPREVTECIATKLFTAIDGGRINDDHVPGFTTLNQGENITYKAHPSFRNERAWHDWVLIKWSEDEIQSTPARIEMFLDLRQSEIVYNNLHILDPDDPDGGPPNVPVLHRIRHLTPGIWAVVWSAKTITPARARLMRQKRPHLKLGYRVEMEDHRRIVNVTSFDSPCFGYFNSVDNNTSDFDQTAIILHPTDEWGDLFLDPNL